MTEGERNGFDKISFEIGKNNEGLENIKEAFKQHELDDDRRHQENVKVLQEINDAITGLKDTIAPIAANYRLTKRRLAFVASIGISLLIGLSWALEAALKWAVAWLLKIKFGGP